jgi:SAM-dependent methyltransferase
VDPHADANRAWWDERAPLHLTSGLYDVEAFVAGASTLRPFERAELGDVAGRSLVHLQCHVGMDSLSWARLGAEVTGLDFSAPALAAARALADRIGVDATFVESDVYDAPRTLGRRFDIVYTGIGALCWLPDIPRWAGVVRDLLAPGGVLYLVETHPLSDALGDDDLMPTYPYFMTEPIHENAPGSYAVPDAATTANDSFSWVHPLSRVTGALLDRGFTIERFSEFDFTVFQRWPFLEVGSDRLHRLPPGCPSLPLLYSLRASVPGDEQSLPAAASSRAIGVA